MTNHRDRPILITGAARSGTSMTAGIVELGGAYGGDVLGKTPHNRKGQFENLEIRNGLVKEILRNVGADPMGQNPLPETECFKLFSREAVERFRHAVLRIMDRQGYTQGVWYYKGAKMCLMWPLWHRAFPQARWVIVRRSKEDIVRSCLKTTFMRAHRKASGWEKWVDRHVECFLEMAAAGLDLYYVWPHKMIGRDLSEIESVIRRLGLVYDESAVLDFIEPALWSGKSVKEG